MSGSLKKNSLITLSGQLLKTLFQGLTFILLARTLGATDFGILISILAICSILSPFVDFGSYHLIIKRIAEGEKFTRVTNETLLILFVASPLFTILLLIVAMSLYGYSFYLVLPIGLAILFSDKLLSLFIAYNVARNKFKIVTYIESLISGLRLLFTGFLFLFEGSIELWALLLLLHGVVSSLIIFALIGRETSYDFSNKPSRKLIREGMPFVWSQVSINANQDFDKLFLAKISGAEVAGIYAAAMRVLNLALIPIYSFYMTAYNRYFQASAKGVDRLKHTKSMLIPTVSIGLVTAIGIYMVAPFVPYILGEEFNSTVELVQLAALIPIIQTLATPFADTLSGYGKQKLRVYSLLAALIVNVILNLLLIPNFGAYGALIASIISNFVFLIGCVNFTLRKSQWC